MNEDGEVLKPPVQLTKLEIYRVRDLKFKRGTRGYNQQVFQQIKIIQCRIPASLDGNTVESDLIQTKTDKGYRDVSYLTLRELYIIQRNSITINKPYIEKWNTILPNENFHWNRIWRSLHLNTIPYKIKSNVYSQIHLNFSSPFMNKADDDTCHLCFRRQDNQQHEILHCKALDELLYKCQRKLRMLVPRSLTQTEKAYGLLENSDATQLRNFITCNIKSALHANRWKIFRDTTQVQVTLENKINKAIKETMVLQYHLAKREQKIDAFEKLFMQKNILGSLTKTGLQTFPLFD